VDSISAKSEKEVELAPWIRLSTAPNFQFPLKATSAGSKSNQVSHCMSPSTHFLSQKTK